MNPFIRKKDKRLNKTNKQHKWIYHYKCEKLKRADERCQCQF